MLSEGSFQLVDQLTEITTADYQMAEQVAETHKNEEDAASLTLSGAPLDDYTMLQNTTKVDLRKSLTELTAAMQKLATIRANLWTKVPVPNLGQLVAARKRGAILRHWWTLRRLR